MAATSTNHYIPANYAGILRRELGWAGMVEVQYRGQALGIVQRDCGDGRGGYGAHVDGKDLGRFKLERDAVAAVVAATF